MKAADSFFPSFALRAAVGDERSFPTGRAVVLCFVKEDCPTCNVAAPALEALHRTVSGQIDVFAIGQTADGNQVLAQRHGLTVPLLDDSALAVSFAGRIEIVPTVILTDDEGREIRRLEGFVRDEWRRLWEEIAQNAGVEPPEMAWDEFPARRPGCGSLSADPIISERLRAEAEGSPLRARRIEVGDRDDVFEFMFDQGYSDGLPVVPPTPERVLRMLGGTRRPPQDLVAVVPPHMGRATVEKVAVNAVMAGCTPACLPVVIAALEAVCTDEFNIHGVMATTMGAAPVMVVNGPIRNRARMEMGLGALGQGNRANATMGRALRLVLRNIGGARPGGVERTTLGSPLKFTMCFAEWEERSPWEPLHVERGLQPSDSAVTVFAMTSGPTVVVDQTSRTAPQLAGSIGLAAAGALHPRAYGVTNVLLVISPEHVDTLQRDGCSKQDLRRRIQEVSLIPRRRLLMDEVSGVGLDPEKAKQMSPGTLDRPIPKFASEDDIQIVVAGGEAGKFSGVFHGWTTGPRGSIPVTRKIEEV